MRRYLGWGVPLALLIFIVDQSPDIRIMALAFTLSWILPGLAALAFLYIAVRVVRHAWNKPTDSRRLKRVP